MSGMSNDHPAMREYAKVRQIAGESRRRWFGSEDFDLVLRVSDHGEFIGFELYYDKLGDEHALCWHPATGFSHMTVDSGDIVGWGHKQTPILVPGGPCDVSRVHADFLAASGALPPDVAAFVLHTLEQHPDFVAPA
jgi:hypothetical protein